MNNSPSKVFKKYVFGTTKLKKIKIKLQLIWTYENMVKFEPFKYNGQWVSIFEKKSRKIFIMPHVKF
jgi:hypothetical protein